MIKKKAWAVFAAALSLLVTTACPSPPTTTTTVWKTIHNLFVASPLPDERFVKGESVSFEIRRGSNVPGDGSSIVWASDRDGVLGQGLAITTTRLSVGAHVVGVSGPNYFGYVCVRVFNNLWELYQAQPAPWELTRIQEDFNFIWADGTADDEHWASYDNDSFDQASTDPSKAAFIAKLDILRHQRFSEPLPFPNALGGETVYDYVRRYVTTIELRLDAGVSYAVPGTGTISLGRGASMWYALASGTKQAVTSFGLFPYANTLYLVLHEERHLEPGEPGHIYLGDGSQLDPQLENGSGHAQAALYCIWVSQYSLYDDGVNMQSAQSTAVSLLRSRFPSRPTHSNPQVQSFINRYLP